jgi:hypothetical protein
VRRHVKASTAGSNSGASSRAHFGGAFATRCAFGNPAGRSALSHGRIALLSVALIAGFATVLAPSALAAVPVKGVTGFLGSSGSFGGQLKTPRGVAVNQSTGNVYVADSENNRVDVFDSNGKFLRAWGLDVVAYGPDDGGEASPEICIAANGDICKAATPPAGVIAAGGSLRLPQGIAINQTTGNVYVSSQTNLRVDEFDENGNFIRAFGRGVVKKGPDNQPGGAEVQTITVKGDSGTFSLSFGGESTVPLAYNASAASVESALDALGAIGGEGGSVTVTGGPGDAIGSNPYTVTFGGSLSGEDVAQIAIDSSELGTPVGSPLTCSSTTTATTTNFQWLRNGSPIAGATTSTYATTIADSGATIQCQVTKLNANAGATKVSSPRRIGSPAPGTPPPSPLSTELAAPAAGATLSVGGTPLGLTMSCAPGSWGNEPTSFSYQWYRNGIALSGNGANTSQYTVQNADLETAAVFQCAVTGTNAGGSTTAVSASTPTKPAPSPAAPGGNTGSPAATVAGPTSATATTTAGSFVFEICNAAAGDTCRVGVTGSAGGEFKSTFNGYLAIAPAGAPNAGDVLVTDPANLRVQEFTANGQFTRTFGYDVETGGVTTFEVCSVAPNCKIGVTGAGSGQFATNTPTRIAEDSAGNIYTVEAGANFRVQKFTLPGNVVTPAGNFDEADLKGTAAANAPTDVAVNPTGNDVLVSKGFAAAATASCPITGSPSAAESRVLEVSPAGALEGTHGVCAGTTPVNGLAVRGSSGNVYLSSTFGDQRIYVLNAGQPVAPTAQITNVSGIGAHNATLNMLINPNGPELPYGLETTYKVEYKRTVDPSFSTLYGTEASAGNRTTAKAITATLDGLAPSTSYDVRLTANKGFGSGSTSQTVTFQTQVAAPAVRLPEFVATSGRAARLVGAVNPNGQGTGYHFEYVDHTRFEESGFTDAIRAPATDEPAGSGATPVAAVQSIAGLVPGAAYNYRLVATNPSGQTVASGSFATPDPSACPNAALRAEQQSTAYPAGTTHLPECMALEMASPPQKFDQRTFLPDLSASGNQVMFHSLAALGGTAKQESVNDEYVATREDSGWTTHSIAPPNSIGGGNNEQAPCLYSNDLNLQAGVYFPPARKRQSVVRAELLHFGEVLHPLSPTLVPFKAPTSGAGSAFANADCQGGTPDASEFVFSLTETAYLSGDPSVGQFSGGEPNPYLVRQDDEGNPSIELVTRDKDGKVWGGVCGGTLGSRLKGVARRGAMAADGSYLYFSTRPNTPESTSTCSKTVQKQRILRRQDTGAGPVMTEIGSSECTRVSPACDRQSDGDDVFEGASLEGNKVFFLSTRQLANSDLDSGTECSSTVGSSQGCDLYMYDASLPAGARLTQVSAGDGTAPTQGKGASVLGVVDIAGNGSRVYFVATGVLTTAPDSLGRTAVPGKPNLYMYEHDDAFPAGRTVLVGTLETADKGDWGSGPGGNNARAVPLLGADIENRATGGDGHILVFETKAKLTPDDADGSFRDIYRFDSDTGALERVSAADPGGTDNGPIDVQEHISGVLPESSTQGPSFDRWVSEDGETVTFSTSEALDPADVDGQSTAYIWHQGTATAILGAEGGLGGKMTVSLSGDEVAFESTVPMVPEDGDAAKDIYVARSDGGFPRPVPAVPCEAEGCQEHSSQPGAQNPATAVGGGGNVIETPTKHKKHKKHRKHHRHQTRASRDQGGQK